MIPLYHVLRETGANSCCGCMIFGADKGDVDCGFNIIHPKTKDFAPGSIQAARAHHGYTISKALSTLRFLLSGAQDHTTAVESGLLQLKQEWFPAGPCM